MNNELIERIDHCLKYHHVPPLLSKVLISCKAALTQQQEAEPVGHVRYITAGGNAGLSWVVDQSGPTCGGPMPRDGQPLYLHPPITAAQPACCRKTPCEHPPGMGPCDKPAAQPQVPEGKLRINLTLSDKSISKVLWVSEINASNLNLVGLCASESWRELSAATEEGKRAYKYILMIPTT